MLKLNFMLAENVVKMLLISLTNNYVHIYANLVNNFAQCCYHCVFYFPIIRIATFLKS